MKYRVAIFTTLFILFASIHGSLRASQVVKTIGPVRVYIMPQSPSVPVGKTLPLSAYSVFFRNPNRTSQGTYLTGRWNSSQTGIATVDNTGVVTGVGQGFAVITFQSGPFRTFAVVNVTPQLLSIAVTPANSSIPRGTTQQMTAMGHYSSGPDQDITSQVLWSSTVTSCATISAGLARASLVNECTTSIHADLFGVTGMTNLTTIPAIVRSVAVTPANPPAIPKGATQQFTARATYTDNTTLDVTSNGGTVWSSLDQTIASVNNTGLATGQAIGSTTIQAAFGGQTGQVNVTVSAPAVVSLDVTPKNAMLPVGLTQQFTATATYTDNSTQNVSGQAAWTSDNLPVATIDNAGLATAVSYSPQNGTSGITAVYGGKSNAVLLNTRPAVATSIVVTPANPTVPAGLTQQFTATGNFSDGSMSDVTSNALWSSSDMTKATITGQGFATTTANQGPTTITATYVNNVGPNASGTTTLTVGAPLLQSIAVTPSSFPLPINKTKQFTATGTYSDNSTADITNSVTWTSADITKFTISNTGLATGVSPSNDYVNLTAAQNSITSPAAGVLVLDTIDSIKITPPDPFLVANATQRLSVILFHGAVQEFTCSPCATWTSGNNNVATVDSNGLVTAHGGVNSTTITANFYGVTDTTNLYVRTSALNSITLSPLNPQVAAGLTQQFTATAHYADTTTEDITGEAAWSSSNGAVSINATGLATAVFQASAQIKNTAGSISASTTMTVTPPVLQSVSINPKTMTRNKGEIAYFTTTGHYSDGTTPNVAATYSSDNTNACNIGASSGQCFTGAVGTAHITTSFGGFNDTATLTVNPAVIKSIDVTPHSPFIVNGNNQQFAAKATYTDNTVVDITNTATWASTNGTTATVNNTGLATSHALGTTVISATQSAITGSTNLNVSSVALTSINITPPSASIVKNGTLQLTATGHYSDNSTQDITSQVTWNSGNNNFVTISGTGLATGVSVGEIYVLAASGNIFSPNVNVNVTNAALVSITVAPLTPTVQQAATQQFTATGHYADNTTQDITGLVNWTSSNAAAATIVAYNGLATAVAPGTSTITAASNNVNGSTTMTVVPVLQSITITPFNLTKIVGGTQQFTAVGHYSDNSTQDITTSVTWSSSATGVATIGSTTGLATTVAAGATTITATLNSVSNSVSFTLAASGSNSPRFAYVANESLSSSDDTIAIYTVDSVTGQLRLRSYFYNGVGTSPFALAVDPAGKFLYVANFGPHTISGYAIDNNTGALSPVPNSPFDSGSSFTDTLTVDPTGKFLFVGNFGFGSNNVSAYTINPATGELTAVNGSPFGGAGTEVAGVAVEPSGKYLYAVSDLGKTIRGYSIDANTGVLTPTAGNANTTGNSPSAVVAEPTDKYVYTANFGGNSISAFSINNGTGVLTELTGAGSPFALSGGAVNPASMAVDPSGKFLYTGETNKVSAFTINNGTGALSEVTGSPYTVTGASSAVNVDPSGQFLLVSDGTGNTIKTFTINPNTGQLTAAGVAPDRKGPISIAITKGRPTFDIPQFEYVSEYSQNSISGYSIDNNTGLLTPIGAVTHLAVGNHPAASASDRPGKFFFVNNNSDLTTSAFTINPANGALTPVNGSPFNTAHHSDMTIDPSGRFLLGTSVGDKNLESYSISSTGALALVGTVCFTSVPNGCQGLTAPLGVAADPLGRFAFSGNTDGTVSAYTIDRTSGAVALVSGSPFAATGVSPSGLHMAVDPYGQFLYGVSFDQSTLSIFTINQSTGAITQVGSNVNLMGQPESVTCDPTGGYVIVGGSFRTQVYSIDRINVPGSLTEVSGSPFVKPLLGATLDPSNRFLYYAEGVGNSIELGTFDFRTGFVTDTANKPDGANVYSVTVTGKLN
ncbi:MAG TPA: Ig-like domain-containing protein [Terriglobales bacterium]|nr:Ig-like domain-containing protein [Terriglobales bacterium]